MTDWLDPEQVKQYIDGRAAGSGILPPAAAKYHLMEQFVRAHAAQPRVTHCDVADEWRRVARLIVEALDD